MPQQPFDLRSFIRHSVASGAFAQVFLSLGAVGASFITAFAVFLGASNWHFSLIMALGFVSNLFQPVGVVISGMWRRRRWPTVSLAFAGRFLALGFALIPFIFEWRSPWAVWVFLALLAASSVANAVAGNLWTGWISDAVPLRIRGRFLARRTQVLMVTGFAAAYLCSWLLDHVESMPDHTCPGPEEWHFMGWVYLFIFGLAVVAGLYGISFTARKPEREPFENRHSKIEIKFSAMFRPWRDANFRRLAVYGVWWWLAIGVGAPFWGVFMLKTMHMSMQGVLFYGVISTILMVLAVPVWGKLIDRFGNKPCMVVCVVMGAINPALWIFAGPDCHWVVYAEAAGSGVMWAGANIIAMNFVLAIAPKEEAQAYSGMYAAVGGVAGMATALLSAPALGLVEWICGANVMQWGALTVYPMQVLFLTTGAARLTALIPLLRIHETRAKSLGAMLAYLAGRIRGGKRVGEGLGE